MVDVKYVWLLNFCYICGILRYFEKDFFRFEEEEVILNKNEYGLWLRVSPSRFKMGG